MPAISHSHVAIFLSLCLYTTIAGSASAQQSSELNDKAASLSRAISAGAKNRVELVLDRAKVWMELGKDDLAIIDLTWVMAYDDYDNFSPPGSLSYEAPFLRAALWRKRNALTECLTDLEASIGSAKGEFERGDIEEKRKAAEFLAISTTAVAALIVVNAEQLNVDPAKAVAYSWEAFSRVEQPDWRLLNLLARSYAMGGDKQAAITWCNAAIDIAPDGEREKLQKQLSGYRTLANGLASRPSQSGDAEPAPAESNSAGLPIITPTPGYRGLPNVLPKKSTAPFDEAIAPAESNSGRERKPANLREYVQATPNSGVVLLGLGFDYIGEKDSHVVAYHDGKVHWVSVATATDGRQVVFFENGRDLLPRHIAIEMQKYYRHNKKDLVVFIPQ